jgi:butyrate kinase
MFDVEACLDQQLLEAKKGRPTVIFPECLDTRIIEAICRLTRFVRPVLLASNDAACAAARSNARLENDLVAYAFAECAFIDISQRCDLVEEYADLLVERLLALGEKMDRDEAIEKASRPPLFAILSVLAGHADAVLGGSVYGPKEYFRPMLKLLKDRSVATEAGVMVLPDEFTHQLFPENILIIGDAGVNSAMDPRTLAEVAVGTCVVARDLFPQAVLPAVHGAMVSYSHRGSDEGQGADLVRGAMELLPEILAGRASKSECYSSISINGDVKVSAILSERSATYYHDNVPTGKPNVLVCPSLDTGNLLFHLFAAQFPDAKKFASIFGVRFRGMSVAQDCTAEDIRLTVKANALRLLKNGTRSSGAVPARPKRRTPADVFFRRYRVLSVNPGSTSTKIAVYEGDTDLFTQEIQHTPEELAPFDGKPITDQFQFRKDAILRFLASHDISIADLDAVSGRGGLLHPMPHGTFHVNDRMVHDLKAGVNGEHASNLGGLIAKDLVGDSGKPAFIVDPVVVDETEERVKITGIKAIRRKVVSHALNQIATAHRYAGEQETFYEKLNIIVCHMGGGISIGAHKRGRYIDANDGLDGEGPFSPQRSGSLPVGAFMKLILSGRYTQEELRQLIKGKGGLIDLLGTSNLIELGRRYEGGDAHVKSILDAQAYQIAKWISSMLPAFDGEKVDRILLTGGMARAKFLVDEIGRLLSSFGCGITVYPGENEMSALAKGALRVLSGREAAKEYAPNA